MCSRLLHTVEPGQSAAALLQLLEQTPKGDSVCGKNLGNKDSSSRERERGSRAGENVLGRVFEEGDREKGSPYNWLWVERG